MSPLTVPTRRVRPPRLHRRTKQQFRIKSSANRNTSVSRVPTLRSILWCVCEQTLIVKAAKLPFAMKKAIVKLLKEQAKVTKKLSRTFGATSGTRTSSKIRLSSVFRLRVVSTTELPTLQSPGSITSMMTGTENVTRESSIEENFNEKLSTANKTSRSVLTTMLGEITSMPPRSKSAPPTPCPPAQHTKTVFTALTVAVTRVDSKVIKKAPKMTLTKCALLNIVRQRL